MEGEAAVRNRECVRSGTIQRIHRDLGQGGWRFGGPYHGKYNSDIASAWPPLDTDRRERRGSAPEAVAVPLPRTV